MVLLNTGAGFNNFDDNTAWQFERWWNGRWRSYVELNQFRSNEKPTVVSTVSQLARLKMSKGEGIQNFFIRAQKMTSGLQQSGKHSSPAIFDALCLTGLLEKYELFIVDETYNPSGDYTGMRNRLLNFSIWKQQRLKQSANHVAMPSNAFSRVVVTIRQEIW